MEADLARLDKPFFELCGVDVKTFGHEGVRLPDPSRVRTYFVSFAGKYAKIGAQYKHPSPKRTALALLDVFLEERPDDNAARKLRAELLADLGDESQALEAFEQLSLGSARRVASPHTPQQGWSPVSAPRTIGTPAPAHLTPATAAIGTASSVRSQSYAQLPQPAPLWTTPLGPRAGVPPNASTLRLSGLAPPVEPLSDSTQARLLPRTTAPQSSPRAGLELGTPPPSSVGGVLGRRRSGAGSASRGDGASTPTAAAGAARTPASCVGRGTQPFRAAAELPLGSKATRGQLEQEIRTWRRQLARSQAMGSQFAYRSDVDWLDKWLKREEAERTQAPAVQAA